jgi:HEPN domain-containing protein
MKDPKHARLMLDMAAADVQALRNMSDPGRFADSIFGFHCQQAVEKLLKAWLSLLGVAFPRTHDLRLLLQLVGDIDPAGVAAFQDLEDLTDYGVQFRYEAPMNLEALDRAAQTESVVLLYRHVASMIEPA